MSVIALNTIKSNIKTLLETNNTTTSSVQDLSSGMTDRVREVAQLNISRLPLQASFFPAITMWYHDKEILPGDIAGSQLAGRRTAEIEIKIAGLAYLSTVTDDLLDDSDNEVENLMENIEEILRSDPSLSSTVKWTKATSVRYHTADLSQVSGDLAEGTMMRVGILTLIAKTLY